MTKLRKLAALSGAEQRFLMTAVVALLGARIRHARLPMQQILQNLQNQQGAAAKSSPPADIDLFIWALAIAGRHVPWRSDCLVQVMAADRWLRRRGMIGDFHLGVAADDLAGLIAHAWLTLDGRTINVGGDAPTRYRPIIAPDKRPD